jgi:hypothetical protein
MCHVCIARRVPLTSRTWACVARVFRAHDKAISPRHSARVVCVYARRRGHRTPPTRTPPRIYHFQTPA